MAYEGDMDDPNANMGTQAEATGTSIGGYAGGGAPGGPSDIGAVAQADAATANTPASATGGWDFPDPAGGWATSAPMGTQDTGEDSNASAPQNPLDSAMSIIDAAIANTGMPAIGQGGLPGMGLQGFGTEMGINTPSSLGPVGLDASLQGQATPGAVGGVTGSMLGPAPGGPNQNQAAGQMAGGMVGGQPGPTASEAQAWGDDTGAATSAGVGLDNSYSSDIGAWTRGEGWGHDIANVAAQQDQTAYGAAQEQGVGLTGSPVGAAQSGDVGIGGYGDQQAAQGWGADIKGQGLAGPNMTAYGQEGQTGLPGTVGTLDSQAAAQAVAADQGTAGAQITGDEQEMEDVDEDYSGMPKGMTSKQTVEALIQALQDPKEAKNTGWLAHDLMRSLLGLPPSTKESRAKDALTQLEAQEQQEEMEMNVSTGEDDRAVSSFKAKYPWAQKMSDFEVQAYINSPELLKLKLDNIKITNKINNPGDPNATITTNDIRALWAPAGAGLPGASLSPQG